MFIKRDKSQFLGSTVFVGHDGNVEKALRKFKKKIAESGKLQDLRDRETYEKPNVTRKKKKAAAKRRWQKKLQQESLPKRLY